MRAKALRGRGSTDWGRACQGEGMKTERGGGRGPHLTAGTRVIPQLHHAKRPCWFKSPLITYKIHIYITSVVVPLNPTVHCSSS